MNTSLSLSYSYPSGTQHGSLLPTFGTKWTFHFLVFLWHVWLLLLNRLCWLLLPHPNLNSAVPQSLAQGCPLACCTLFLIPSFKWHQHISQISLSSLGLSPQLHTLQPSAYLKFPCRCLSVISDLTCPKQKTWFFSSQKSVVLPVFPISANGTFGQPLHWGLVLDSLLSVTLPPST